MADLGVGPYQSIEAIKAAYPDHWIWIDQPNVDQGRTIGGRVIHASQEPQEFYEFVAAHRGEFQSTAFQTTRRPRGDSDFVVSVWEIPKADQ